MREKKLPSQTLPDFQQYLLSRKLVPEKSVTFYAYWANRYLTFSKRLKNADAAEALRRFLEDLQSRENIADWQIQQAKEAIQLYTDHFHGGKKAGIADDDAKTTLAPFDKDLVMVNPVRKSSTFQRGGSHGALNPVFALKGIIYSSPLQAAGLSNGANMQKAIRVKHYSLSTERTYMDWARRFFDYAGNMKGGLQYGVWQS